MAISAALVTGMEGESTTDANNYTTASFTPAANTLYLLSVSSGKTGAVDTPTVTGAGLTWVQVQSVQNQNHRTTVFRAMGTGSAGTLTIAHGAQQSNCAWRLISFTGVDTTGTNGSGAVVQSNTATGTSSPSTVTLASAVTSGNTTFGAHNQNSTSGAVTAGSGFTLLGSDANTNPGTPSTKLVNEWSSTGTNPVAYTVGSVEWGIVGVEVAAAPTATAKTGSDTLNLDENETSVLASFTTATDSLGLDENETGTSVGTATATDTLGLDENETHELTVSLGAGFGSFEEGFGGGAANLAITETSSLVISASVSGADTLNLDENETSAAVISTTKTGADTLNLDENETSATLAIFSGANTVGLDENETTTLAVSLSGADAALGLDVNEAGSVVGSVTAKTGADTLNLDENETSAVVISTTKTGADTLGLDENETGAVGQVGKSGADTLGLDENEIGTVTQVGKSGADSLGLDENETFTLANRFAGADSLGLDENEASAAQVSKTGTDTLGLDENEASALQQCQIVTYPATDVYPSECTWPYSEPAGGPGSSADTLGLDVNEASALVIVAEVASADTLNLDENETSATVILTLQTGADTLNLDENETSATVISTTKTGADTLGLDENESGSIQELVIFKTGADSLNLDSQEATGLATTTGTYPANTTFPGGDLYPFPGAELKSSTDTLRLDVNEAGIVTSGAALSQEFWGVLQI